ncbi:hypothetical protein [Catenulispora pinisilvae]|uniref:hypothetical protein n=1 Tax=Catenulispora pinisilvae TaxID=2705253 RepID=UPI001891D96A|nr:hypothetical protein [Catenulispora pinisilvae]
MSWSFRYSRDPGSAFDTDEFRHFDSAAGRLLALVDSNGVPPAAAPQVRAVVFDEIDRAAGDGASLLDALTRVRAVATDWFAKADLPLTGCFLNVGLVELGDAGLTLAGAYAPVYRLSRTRPTCYTDFPGPVTGPGGMLRHPLRTIAVDIQADEHVLIPSDGLLESRTTAGKINGDSHLKRCVEEFFDSGDVHEAVLGKYRDNDAELHDSRSLLSITRAE